MGFLPPPHHFDLSDYKKTPRSTIYVSKLTINKQSFIRSTDKKQINKPTTYKDTSREKVFNPSTP